MSKSRGERTGSSSLKSRPPRTPSVNNPGKAPDTQSEQNGDTSEQICEATAERKKRRAASPHRNLWEKVLKNMGKKVQDQSFETWFEPLFIIEITDTAVVFDAPEQLIADWVEINYTDFMKAELEIVGIFDRSVVIEFLDSQLSRNKDLKGFEFNG